MQNCKSVLIHSSPNYSSDKSAIDELMQHAQSEAMGSYQYVNLFMHVHECTEVLIIEHDTG